MNDQSPLGGRGLLGNPERIKCRDTLYPFFFPTADSSDLPPIHFEAVTIGEKTACNSMPIVLSCESKLQYTVFLRF